MALEKQLMETLSKESNEINVEKESIENTSNEEIKDIPTETLDKNEDTSENVNEKQDEEKNVSDDEQKETVETNCLALTVRKDYSLSIIKNSFVTTLRVSWKIAISTFILNLLRFLF